MFLIMRIYRSFVRSLAALCVVALTGGSVAAQQAELNVVASFSIIADMAEAVGGDRVAVRSLVGPNGDAHVFEPRPSDAIALARADVVLINGLQFEGFIGRLVEASDTEASVTEVTDGIDVLKDPQGGHYHFRDGEAIFHAEPFDPHAWQSIASARVYAANIARAFCEADAAGCETYKANADAYAQELAVVDEEIRTAISALPEERRVVVVAHNAFRYFERDYGIRFLAPQGVSTESEASAADVASLVREIREHRAGAVFAENIADDRLVRQIADEAGIPLAGTLYSDALSALDGDAPTYLKMMRHNLKTIIAALK